MDTAAMDHLTGDLDRLNMQEPYTGHDHVHTTNGSGMRISHTGQSSLSTHTSTPLHLKNVLYVPEVTRNLLSVKKLTRDNNVFVEFHPYDVFVKDRDSREIIISGQSRGGIYPIGAPRVIQAFSSVRVSSAKWHCRLGHPASLVVQHVLHRHALPIESSNKDIFVCDACQQGKSHQLPFSLSNHVIKTPLELIYSDVWGPTQTSVSGHNYYVSFIDAYSRFTWLYLPKRKSGVFDVFVQFQTHVERLLGHKILHIQSD
jgi:histone deacetylase 1/2